MSVSTELPVSFTSEPAPEMTAEIVCAAEDEYLNVAPLAMLIAWL